MERAFTSLELPSLVLSLFKKCFNSYPSFWSFDCTDLLSLTEHLCFFPPFDFSSLVWFLSYLLHDLPSHILLMHIPPLWVIFKNSTAKLRSKLFLLQSAQDVQWPSEFVLVFLPPPHSLLLAYVKCDREEEWDWVQFSCLPYRCCQQLTYQQSVGNVLLCCLEFTHCKKGFSVSRKCNHHAWCIQNSRFQALMGAILYPLTGE